jgi:hypothetical protein
MVIFHRVGATLPAPTLLLVACGDDDGEGGSTDVEVGCSSSDPDSIEVNDTWLGSIEACQRDDGSVEIVNVSPLVLLVHTPVTARVEVLPSQQDTSAAQAAALDALLGADPRRIDGRVYLRPGATADVAGAGGADQIFLDVDQQATVQTYAVNAAVRWTQTKLARPGETLARSIVTCATEVDDLWTAQVNRTGRSVEIDVLMIDAVEGGLACRGLVQQVYNLLDEPSPPTLTTLGSEFRSAVTGLRSTVLDDLLAFARRVVVAT